jgi:hypothetical protein
MVGGLTIRACYYPKWVWKTLDNQPKRDMIDGTNLVVSSSCFFLSPLVHDDDPNWLLYVHGCHGSKPPTSDGFGWTGTPRKGSAVVWGCLGGYSFQKSGKA